MKNQQQHIEISTRSAYVDMGRVAYPVSISRLEPICAVTRVAAGCVTKCAREPGAPSIATIDSNDHFLSCFESENMYLPPACPHDPVNRKRKTVVVIDDHPLVAVALRDLISLYSLAAEIRTFSTIGNSINVLQKQNPALVLLDLGLPDINACDAITAVRRHAPDALLAILSGDDDTAHAIPDVQNNAIPFLCKSSPYPVLTRAVRDLLARCGLADNMHEADRETGIVRERLESLSPKQRKILKLLITGRTNQEIATVQNVSIQTIKTHLHGIYTKLEVKSRSQAVFLASLHRHTWGSDESA
jgi:RNA polymerase sigma factor (sigma-70 family)